MTSFSDADLARLKEAIKDQPKSAFVSWFEVQDMEALLARLEAAEDLLESLMTIIPKTDRSISMDRQEEAGSELANELLDTISTLLDENEKLRRAMEVAKLVRKHSNHIRQNRMFDNALSALDERAVSRANTTGRSEGKG